MDELLVEAEYLGRSVYHGGEGLKDARVGEGFDYYLVPDSVAIMFMIYDVVSNVAR